MNEVRELSQSGENSHENTWLLQISLYIDKRLEAPALVRLEQHLSGCSECRQQLAGLRQTVQLLNELPQPKMPRSFTLTSAQARALRPRPLYHMAQAAAAIAAIFLAISLILDYSGAFASKVAPVSQAVVATPAEELPLVGTRPPTTPCPTNGLACAQSGLGGEVTSPAPPTPAPTIAPIVTATSDNLVSIRLAQILLTGLVLVLAAFAFSLRPRAPSRR